MVHVIFDGTDVRLENFYQLGDGSGSAYFEGLPLFHQRGVGYFVGSSLARQRGYGLGDIFRSIYRALKPMAMKIGHTLAPMAKEAGRAIGNEGIAVGARALTDIVQGKEPKAAIADEGREGVRRLIDKANTTLQQKLQRGSGKKRRKKGVGAHVMLKPDNIIGKAIQFKRPLVSSAKLITQNPPKKQRHDALGYY